MQPRDYIEANAQAWAEAQPKLSAQRQAELRERFRRPGYSCLDAVETAALERIGVAGKSVAQLCCNNGRELISVVNLGAARGVGFDIVEAFLAEGRELAGLAGADCEFHAGDVLAVPAGFDAAFELVLITVGALSWLPEPSPLFAVARRLLKAGGHVVVHEQHPLCDVFTPGDAEPFRVRHSYFRTEPFVIETGLDYIGNVHYASKRSYWFHHKLSDIVMACIDNGLGIERFEEHPHDIGGDHGALAQGDGIQLPLSYVLVARAG